MPSLSSSLFKACKSNRRELVHKSMCFSFDLLWTKPCIVVGFRFNGKTRTWDGCICGFTGEGKSPKRTTWCKSMAPIVQMVHIGGVKWFPTMVDFHKMMAFGGRRTYTNRGGGSVCRRQFVDSESRCQQI
ncbi:unnamed protein product [Lactuca virosa]|uniref:Uncharacterized protein n=1 Tax=Lactuca virosa TaxID=75947 RepID=A0AAU9MTW2_9ASTR|nr:unnamed protein product [Lactuca virosa]